MKSSGLTDLIHNHTSIIETISGEITSSVWPSTQSYIRIIQTTSGEITSSDWPGKQSYINFRDHIWWKHQFWPTWYTIIHYNYRDHIWWNHYFWLTWYTSIYQNYRDHIFLKSQVLTDLVHNHSYQNYREHIWWNHQFDWPGKQSYIRIIEATSGEITSSDWHGAQSYIRIIESVCVVCMIPCECNHFWVVLNFTFKLEPCIDHIKVSDKFENWWLWPWSSRSNWPWNLQHFGFNFFSKFNLLEFYLQTWIVYWSSKCLIRFWKLVTLTLIFKVKVKT